MKFKKLIILSMTVILLLNMSLPTLAYNYSFESGVDYSDVLGSPTSTDNPVSPDPLDENTRRNKDAAYLPPPYGVFSGDIPTDPSSLYHDNYSPYNNNIGGVSYTPYNELPATSLSSSDILNTQPLYYADGSIGTLTIPKLNITVKVYEGESLENMRNGIGHFAFTSAWDGNVCFAGHNRGVPASIGKIKDLVNGDEIIYETKYGTRTYEVYSKQKIADTDYSALGWSDTNIITMITCVEGVGNMRWCVSAVEKINF